MQVDLSPDEALVLFDFLSRWEKSERFELADQAEERVLWNIHAGLESRLAEPFSPDYARLLDEARARVRDPESAAATGIRVPAKLAIIGVTLLPLVYFSLFIGMIGMAFSSSKPPLFAHFGLPFLVVHLAMMLVMFALLAFYVVFLFKTKRVRGDVKVVWALALFMGGIIAMPIFWYLYIWRDE